MRGKNPLGGFMKSNVCRRICCVFIAAAVFSSCAVSADSVSVVSWNVQTFFDANTVGTEYSEFIRSNQWNAQAYETRVGRLCEVMQQLDADIFIFEEIENADILIDISNKLAGTSWNQRRSWKYTFFSKNEGSSIGCAVLSRFPLKHPTVHTIDIRTENDSQPDMRPLIRVTAMADGRELVLFVNHWKSKAGGAEKSEVWRDWQETLLANLMQKDVSAGKAVLAVGDFNRDIMEFECREDSSSGATYVQLDGDFSAVSPWFCGGALVEPGSYYYNGGWERIDHFFASQNITFLEFRPAVGKWCEDSGAPKRYKIYTGQGYSDHLPLFCRIRF